MAPEGAERGGHGVAGWGFARVAARLILQLDHLEMLQTVQYMPPYMIEGALSYTHMLLGIDETTNSDYYNDYLQGPVGSENKMFMITGRYADGTDGMFDAEETIQQQPYVQHSYDRQSDNYISANASNGTNDSMFEDDDHNDDADDIEQSFPNQFDSNSVGHISSNISEEENLTDEELDDVAPKYDIFGDDAPDGVDEVDDLVEDSAIRNNVEETVEHLPQQDIQDFLDAEEAIATARSSSQEVRDHHAPRMGMAFDSDDAAHKFFNDYALLCGFAITKARNYHAKKQGSTGHTRVTFRCNRSGKPVDEETLEAKRK
ncbi:hypothetical protein ACQ4PT_010970 [Festuca glaucescens]